MNSLLTKSKHYFRTSSVVNGSVWVVGGMAANQLIRLTVNLILTRLLVPEYFGLMAIVNSTITIFIMMTDVALLPNVINTKRDKEAVFMKTVWSTQVLVAVVVVILVCAAAYPISVFYEEPILFPLLCFASICTLISGFTSVSILIEQKFIRQKQLVINQFFAQLFGGIAMVAFAYYFPTVWALVFGLFVSVLYGLWASYKFFNNHYSSFELDKSSLLELYTFGRWILISSFFTGISLNFIPMLVGAWLGMSKYGVYVIGANLAMISIVIATRVCDKVLAPRYRQIVLEKEIFKISQIRNKFVSFLLLPMIFLMIFGEQIITFLYDERYEWAGPVLQLLALGNLFTLLSYSAKPLLMAFGDSKSHMYIQIISAFLGIGILAFSVNYIEDSSLVILVALLPVLDYLLVNIFLRKYQTKVFEKDIFIILPILLTVMIIWYFSGAESFNVLSNFIIN